MSLQLVKAHARGAAPWPIDAVDTNSVTATVAHALVHLHVLLALPGLTAGQVLVARNVDGALG